MGRDNFQRRLEPLCDLFFTRNTRGVNVIDSRADLVGITETLECMQQFLVTLRELDGNDISVQALDRWENIIKVRVAEVRMSLGFIRDTGSGKFEGVHRPLQVFIPIRTAQWQLEVKKESRVRHVDLYTTYALSNGGLVDLDRADTFLLEINDFVTERKGQLLGLQFARSILARERPIQNSDGTSEHTLHWLLSEPLGVATPSNSHGSRTTDI